MFSRIRLVRKQGLRAALVELGSRNLGSLGMVEPSLTSKKRILVLTPRFPYPPLGGDRLRIYQICRQLSTRFELCLLSMCESEEEMDAPLPNDGVFTNVERIFNGR